MTADDELLAQCLATPDDDASRLVWADAIGGERGELVALQCGARTPERDRRQRALVAAHGLRWSGLRGLSHVRYHRGFVDAIEVSADTWLEQAPKLVALAPFMTGLGVSDLTRPHFAKARERLEAVVTSPEFARVRAFNILDSEAWGDTAAETLAAAGVVDQLVALGLPSALTMHGLTMLGSSMSSLERLWLHHTFPHQQMLGALQTYTPRLDDFDASVSVGLIPHVAKLPLTSLTIRSAERGIVRALANSALAPRLERLVISGALAVDDIVALGALPKLHSLAFELTLDTAEHWQAFRALELPALRNFRALYAGAHARDAIALRFGPQLELLDLRGDLPLAFDPIERKLLHLPYREAPWEAAPRSGWTTPGWFPAWLVTGEDRVWDLRDLGAEIHLGSLPRATIRIDHPSVSDQHARLVIDEDAHVIEDFNTLQGTYLNDQRITRRRLADGDVLRLGDVSVRYHRSRR